ncbi:nuclear hormone receptor FTZ-F1-like [Uranotaenia lowii]|uniref:nuclear hormone receptor FTZ-F1-like n=1 Tax=Uranotaenia lowii TaxID=190385 RepID=UPI00247A59E3|nr:nuclear hormone receptor FTZ-F1-like [Uranotaenia lowii]XP_055601501.1 nuclear hormone receptor FTZ-F1-like [Uranotaenia lowii]
MHHEEASPTASSSTAPSNKSTTIGYVNKINCVNISGGGNNSLGVGGAHINGNLLITTSSSLADVVSQSVYELIQQHQPPQLHHHQQLQPQVLPNHTTKLIITNNNNSGSSSSLITTTSGTSPAAATTIRPIQHHTMQQQQQHHHITSQTPTISTNKQIHPCSSTTTTTTTLLIGNPDNSPFSSNDLHLSNLDDPNDPTDDSVPAGLLNIDTVAAAAALIDLHPTSSSSTTATTHHPDQLAIGGTDQPGSSSSAVVGLHDPIEIKIPEEEPYPAEEGSDGGYHDNITQTQSNYLAIPPTELCPVCGDKVSGYHYGLLTCESCKGFFKRTVQNKKVYTCVAERQCHIDKTQRKRCPYCRFQKCLEVGMKLEAVRADRMRGGRNKFGPMYKRDRARKLQIMRQRQLALQALRGSIGGGVGIGQLGTDATSPAGLQGIDYHQPYSNMHIKQEIQIPQVSSLTSSPDSSPSPIAIALGQVNPQTTISLSSGVGGNGSSGGGGGGGSNSSGAGTGSSNSSSTAIQNQLSESKLWMSANSTTASPHSLSPKTFSFDSGTNPTSTADSDNPANTLRVSPMIRDFVQSIDDREWQTSLFSLLQSQSYNQCEVDLFELMCKVLDQNLFSQVDWARNTIFFKDLKVDDQMKLLQNSWSDMLVLDHIHQRLHNGLPDDTTLHNGQKFDLLGLGLLGVPSLADRFNELQNKLQELKFDVGDYICMKFLLLLNPGKGEQDVRGITNRKTVVEGYENVQAALLDYTLTCYPSVPDKFSKLLSIIPEIHAMAARGEEHLYIKHCAGSAPSQTLLMEMLHAKRK